MKRVFAIAMLLVAPSERLLAQTPTLRSLAPNGFQIGVGASDPTCVFRPIAITDSGASRSLIPIHRDHPFRPIAITRTLNG